MTFLLLRLKDVWYRVLPLTPEDGTISLERTPMTAKEQLAKTIGELVDYFHDNANDSVWVEISTDNPDIAFSIFIVPKVLTPAMISLCTLHAGSAPTILRTKKFDQPKQGDPS